MGEITFPIFEPILKLAENKNPEVRRHFNEALLSLHERKQAIALLNLNMVLSLKPNHFLARVFRGRIYAKGKKNRLASEDYLEANRISPYRFIYYDLYREYLKLVNYEFEVKGGIILKNFDDTFNTLHINSCMKDLEPEASHAVKKNLSVTEPDDVLIQNLALTPEEIKKFETLGPISQQEIEETNWDLLMDDLNS